MFCCGDVVVTVGHVLPMKTARLLICINATMSRFNMLFDRVALSGPGGFRREGRS
jgi:hypothetical protein